MYLVFYLVLIGQITSLLLSLCLTGLKEIDSRDMSQGSNRGSLLVQPPQETRSFSMR
jgi:hypothetical protein